MDFSVINNEVIQMMTYSLMCLPTKGISIPDTVHMCLENLIYWHYISKNQRYIELAALYLLVLSRLGMCSGSYALIYYDIIQKIGWSDDEIQQNRIFENKRIKANKTQVRAIIRKWMPSKENPQTITEVVDDILEKVKKQELGCYRYIYQKKNTSISDESKARDVYVLVIEKDESYVLDLKSLKCYTFIRENR